VEKELEGCLKNIPLLLSGRNLRVALKISHSYLVEKELEGCLENILLLLSGEGTRGLP
jgi:hypothetical protein